MGLLFSFFIIQADPQDAVVAKQYMENLPEFNKTAKYSFNKPGNGPTSTLNQTLMRTKSNSSWKWVLITNNV
jgi:hypothetical protein